MKGLLLDRRTVLRGLGGALIGLPFLDAMWDPKAARADVVPKRFVVFFSPDGTVPGHWDPGGTPTAPTSSPILAPLDAFKKHLLYLKGFDSEVAYHGVSDGHTTGMACMLTAVPLRPGTLFCANNCIDPNVTVGWAGGTSIDQHIGARIQGKARFPSLELGVSVVDADIWSRMSYRGENQPLPPEIDPHKSWTRLFQYLLPHDAEAQSAERRRKSVLDVVRRNYSGFSARLGKEDAEKLDHHLTSVRALETQLNQPLAQLGGACRLPGDPDPGDLFADENYEALGRLQMDLLVMALSCDITRVASLQWDRAASVKTFPHLGITEAHHALSHAADDDLDAQAKLVKINHWYAQQFAYLLAGLRAIPEGDGTLLDHTVVLWCNELSVGNTHSRRDLRWLLAGSGGGVFKTGRCLQFNGEPHNQLLVSIANAVGVETHEFGEYYNESTKGPMEGLTEWDFRPRRAVVPASFASPRGR